MVEAVGRVVGGQAVVVEAVFAASTDDEAPARLEARDVPRPVTWRWLDVDERVDRLLQRRVPHAVVDEIREPGLEPLLLVHQVGFERQGLEIVVGLDEQRECSLAPRRSRGS